MEFNFKNSLLVTIIIFLVCVCSLKALEYLYNRGQLETAGEDIVPFVQVAPASPVSEFSAPPMESQARIKSLNPNDKAQLQTQRKQDICEMYSQYNDLAHEKNSAIIPEFCKD
jgi:hypothetical protein